jgi:DtxR family Mn-dependent transcriptional regulator
VNDSSDEFLKYLNKYHIALGSQLKVISKESFDESMTIQIGKNQLNISKVISNNLYVKTN